MLWILLRVFRLLNFLLAFVTYFKINSVSLILQTTVRIVYQVFPNILHSVSLAEMGHGCSFTASQDLYGIGVRVGLYCQWAATVLASIKLPEATAAMKTTTLCFQCATFSALVLITVRGDITQPEVLIVLPLSFGGFIAANVPSYSNHQSGSGSGSAAGIFGIMQIFGAFVGYNLWFWWYGVNVMGSSSCKYYTLIFAKVEIHKVRVLGILFSTISGILFIVFEVFFVSWAGMVILKTTPHGAITRFSQVRKQLGTTSTARWRLWVSSSLGVLSILYLVIMIEMTIRWNGGVGANTMENVGQLIPLVIGLAGLGKTIYEGLKAHLVTPNVNSEGVHINSLPVDRDT